MFKSLRVFHDHKDLVHDVAYDFHGKRVATCSSDQSVKVWDLNENGQWICSASWKVHSGSVWRVSWAHPEFGQILATCSFDRTAVIWEEILSESTGISAPTRKHWIKRCSLVDSRSNVSDVKFAPKHLGLMLATCARDGAIRIYEAPDVMNVSQWNLQHEISTSKLPCSCLAWNPSKFHPPMLAVGSDDVNAPGAKVTIYEYCENTRKWCRVEALSTFTAPAYDLKFAPYIARSFHLLGIASKDVQIYSLKPLPLKSESDETTKFETKKEAQFTDHRSQVWRVSWNITGTMMASSAADGTVRVWKEGVMGKWQCITVLRPGENGLEMAQLPDKAENGQAYY